MNIAISGIGAFVDFLVLFYFYYRINKNPDLKNNFYYYFSRFVLFFSMFYLFFSTPILLAPNNSTLIGAAYIIGHVFAYIAFAYLARIVFLINKPSLSTDKLFYGYLIVGALVTILNIIFFNYPVVLDNGITEWNQKTFVGVIIILFGMTVFLPAAVSFIREGIRQKSSRRRYLLLGISFALIILGGPLHDVAKTPGMSLLADAITTGAFLVMFAGILSKNTLNIKK